MNTNEKGINWISVEERLPKERVVVLIYNEYARGRLDYIGMHLGWLVINENGRFWRVNGEITVFEFEKVKFWASLDEPPLPKE